MALTLLWGLGQRGEKARSRVADTEILYLGLDVIGAEVFAPSLHAAPEDQAFVFKEIKIHLQRGIDVWVFSRIVPDKDTFTSFISDL